MNSRRKFLLNSASLVGGSMLVSATNNNAFAIFKNKIYQLTWQNNKIFVYNLNDITRPASTLNWGREGWGATNDGKNIIISDGTSKLYFTEPDENKKEMRVDRRLCICEPLAY